MSDKAQNQYYSEKFLLKIRCVKKHEDLLSVEWRDGDTEAMNPESCWFIIFTRRFSLPTKEVNFRVTLNLIMKASLSASFCYENWFCSNANKANFPIKSFALSLAFIIRFITTRKWPIELTKTEKKMSENCAQETPVQ